jgi:hypothetical protein
MKSMSQLQTVSDIKGMHSIGARSIPKAMRSSFLELYVLDREKARLEKEKFGLDKRRNSAQTRLDSIAQRVEKLKKEIEEKTDVTAQCSVTSKKPLKKMSIKY